MAGRDVPGRVIWAALATLGLAGAAAADEGPPLAAELDARPYSRLPPRGYPPALTVEPACGGNAVSVTVVTEGRIRPRGAPLTVASATLCPEILEMRRRDVDAITIHVDPFRRGTEPDLPREPPGKPPHR